MPADETRCSKVFSEFGKNNDEGFLKHRDDGIAKSSRIMTNGFECIIMKVFVSKHREEGIAKESRNV